MNILGNLETIDFITDSIEAPGLANPRGIAQAKIKGETYIYVASWSDSAIQVLKIASDGSLTPVHTLTYSASNALSNPIDLSIVSQGGETYVVATAWNGQSLSLYRIDNDNAGSYGELTHASTITNTALGGAAVSTNALYYPTKLDTISVGGKSFVAVTAFHGDALSIFEVDDSGNLNFLNAVYDTASSKYHLDGATQPQFYTVGNKVFLYTASEVDDGITVFQMNKTTGALTYVADYNLPNGSGDNLLPLSYNGEDLMIAVSNTAIRVYRIESNGQLTFLQQTDDSAIGTYYLDWLTPMTIDGVDFFVATDNYGGTRMHVLSLDDNYGVQIVQSISGTEYDNGEASTIVTLGSQTYIVSTAYDTSRVTVTRVGGGSDIITGTASADHIIGQDGEDDLLGKNGDDLLDGGKGEDVLVGHFGNDWLRGGADDDVLVGGADNDTLEGGSGADFMKGGAGIDTASYEGSGSGVEVNLSTGEAHKGDAEGDQFLGIENLEGSAKNDKLTGDGKANLIEGGKGNDILSAAGGNDTILGEEGNDKVSGDGGDDSIDGGAGNDRAYGGAGNDVIGGGNGKDKLYGDDGNDTISGGAGDDTITGGAGDDELQGDTGIDVFDFQSGFGNDTISGFVVGLGGDVLDLSDFAEISSLATFRAYALTIAGNTYLTFDDVNVSITILGVTETQFTDDNFIY